MIIPLDTKSPKDFLTVGNAAQLQKRGAIHFHILTDQIPIKLLRHVWCGIVAKWETEKGFEVSKLGGVDIRLVYNASNYISRYISKETKEGTIFGGGVGY